LLPVNFDGIKAVNLDENEQSIAVLNKDGGINDRGQKERSRNRRNLRRI